MKRKRTSLIDVILLVMLLFVTDQANAQLTFQKTWGGPGVDYAYDMHKAPGGGYYFGGVTSSWMNTASASYILRTDDNADTLWTVAYATTDSACNGQYINDIFPNSDGGCIAVGGKSVCGNALVGGNIVRWDANGNLVWAKYCSQSEDPYPVIQDNAGNFIVGGYVTGIGAGGEDACLMKLDANGDTLWSRTYGGTGDDWFYHIVQTNDGGYLAAGFTTSYGQGNRDVYLVKTDGNGNLQWSKAYGTANYESAFGHSLDKTADGGYIIAGQGDNGATSTHGFFLMKVDGLGILSWANYYDGRYAHAVKQTPDHGYVMSGTSGTGIALIKTDSLGTIQWNKDYQGRKGLILELANDGGYVTGGQENYTGNDQVLVIKTDASGNSGCNETTPLPMVTRTTAPFITVNAPSQVSAGAATVSYVLKTAQAGTQSNLCMTLGTKPDEKIQTSITVFPNPGNGLFRIRTGEDTVIPFLCVYNRLGQKIIEARSQELDLSAWPDGVYIIRVEQSRKIDFCKLVKYGN